MDAKGLKRLYEQQFEDDLKPPIRKDVDRRTTLGMLRASRGMEAGVLREQYHQEICIWSDLHLVLHPAVPDPRIHETGYRVGAWRWPRGRFLYGAKSPFFSWTRSPASTPYCETGDSSGERAL